MRGCYAAFLSCGGLTQVTGFELKLIDLSPSDGGTTMSPPEANTLKLAICELHHPRLHGFDGARSTNGISGQFMALYTYPLDYRRVQDTIRRASDDSAILVDRFTFTDVYADCGDQMGHPIVRNFLKVCRSPRVAGPQIVKVVRLAGGEDMAIIKTHWLRILQRRWRRGPVLGQDLWSQRAARRQAQNAETQAAP
jgi:hypothetical protein